MFSGFKFLGVILVTAIPFGIYDLVEAMDNVESASAAGDSFPTTARTHSRRGHQLLRLHDGQSLYQCHLYRPSGLEGHGRPAGLLGRHPVWVMLVLCSLGILSTITALVPVISILPILLYIGMLIGSQAFQETPARHAPAIVLALVPQIASWAKSQIDNALGAAGTSASKLGIETLTQNSVLYDGMSTLGGGATLVGIILGSITVFIIDQKLAKAAAFAAAGAILTFFGLMHSDTIGFAMTPKVAAGYLFIGVVLLVLAKFATLEPKPKEVHHPHSMSGGRGGGCRGCRRIRRSRMAAPEADVAALARLSGLLRIPPYGTCRAWPSSWSRCKRRRSW